MHFIERFRSKTPVQQEIQPSEQKAYNEDEQAREERLRAKALLQSGVFEYIGSLSDEIRIDQHPWCPEIYIKNPINETWNYFTITGREDGAVQIGNSLPLSKKHATDLELIHEAFGKALDASQSLDHEPQLH